MSEEIGTSPTVVVNSHIQITPGTCGGKPRIAGHRIRVEDIVVWHERMNLSVDEIIARYPQLTLAEVYAALAYYHDHREQIDAQMETGKQRVEEMCQLYPSKIRP